MMLTLYTEDYFNAAHHLKGYEGKCSRLHGHSWKVAVWVRGEESRKNKTGLLWDFNNLKKIIAELDHNNLNDILSENPTVENLVAHIHAKLKEDAPLLQFKVRVYESLVHKESYCEAGDFS